MEMLHTSDTKIETDECTICKMCGNSIEEQFIKVPHGDFHVNCFRCKDCNQVVTRKFFPYTTDDGDELILCRDDYFKRISLVCVECNGLISGAHISVLGKNYHLDHFSCAFCGENFDGKVSYFEHGGSIYCQKHYSSIFALRCGGCGNPVLKNFVKYRTCNGSTQHWHPQCFMIYKLWDVRISSQISSLYNPRSIGNNKHPNGGMLHPSESGAFESSPGDNLKSLDGEDLPGLNCIGKILKTLTAFEEDAAECISNACIYFSDQRYPDTVLQAAHLVSYITALFKALTFVSGGVYAGTGEKSFGSLVEPKNLTKQVTMFLSSFVQPHSSKISPEGKPLRETVILVTRLAQTLKLTIEVALRIALRLEMQLKKPQSLATFLDIIQSPKNEEISTVLANTLDSIKKKRCIVCSTTADQTCIMQGDLYWHSACAKCSTCGELITYNFASSSVDEKTKSIYCSKHMQSGNTIGLKKIPFVACYVLLLEISLINLCSHFNIELDGKSRLGGVDVPTDEDGEIHSAVPPTLGAPENSDPAYTQLSKFDASPCVQSSPCSRSDSSIEITPTIPQQISAKSILDLSEDEHWALRESACQHICDLFRNKFSPDQIMRLFSANPRAKWSRMMSVLKKPQKQKVDGLFGVPLDVLVERYGVYTNIGADTWNKKVPVFVDVSIKKLMKMDLKVEGIFRKNGNIKKLKDISSTLNQNPGLLELGEDSIQIAALLKKFLRELPEPILTHKLYKLFIESQSLPIESERKDALHSVCCLLPRENLDMLFTLLWFLRYVAQRGREASRHNENGSKMDLSNIAKVMAPNFLHAKSRSFEEALCYTQEIGVLMSLLTYQEDFLMIPVFLSQKIPDGATARNSQVRDPVINQ